MGQVEHVPRGIGDEQLNTSAPMVRALVVERLELMWRTCQPFIDGSAGRVDPRFLEAGVRIVDRLMRIYRLDTPAQAAEPPMEVSDRALLVERALAEVEAKVRGSEG